MSTTTYSTNAGRINEVKGEILAHAIPVEVLAMGCTMKQMPKRQGDNITYRRYLPFGATATDQNTQNRPLVDPTAHITQEGVTPPADQLTPVDVNVKQQQYACLYSYTDKAAELYEDDIPEEMKIQTGERMGLVREMIRYGSMRACTNVEYAGGSTRLLVDETISLNELRKMSRTLKANHTKKQRRMLSPSANYDTYAVEASFIVFAHTNAESDIRDLPGFVPCAKYGQKSPLCEEEIGSCEEFRFVLSPELASYPDAATSVTASTVGLYSTQGTNPDVYPFIISGQDSVYDVALRGLNSFDPYHIPHTKRDKSDPGGQRGYVGASFWSAVLITNNGWMGVIEAGVSDLS
jgi:N4-gp56 family major capsid protein